MEAPSKHRAGIWVILAAVLLLNFWFDYRHPALLIIDAIFVFIMLFAYRPKSN